MMAMSVTMAMVATMAMMMPVMMMPPVVMMVPPPVMMATKVNVDMAVASMPNLLDLADRHAGYPVECL